MTSERKGTAVAAPEAGKEAGKPDAHDPAWFVAPIVGTVLALVGVPFLVFMVGLAYVSIRLACDACTASMGAWWVAAFMTLMPPVIAVAGWLGPRTRRWRVWRISAVGVMVLTGLLVAPALQIASTA